MSFQTISLLLNWMALGVLLAILFRLSHTFDLIANTQRELRRAIHHLGDHRAAEAGVSNVFAASGAALVSRTPHGRAGTESTTSADDRAGLSPVGKLLNPYSFGRQPPRRLTQGRV